MRKWLILVLLFIFSIEGKSQKTDTAMQIDTVEVDSNFHSPKKAAILSAILPGAGQVYNEKWWKVPIIYAGLGTATYFFISSNNFYHAYRNEYIFRVNNPGEIQDFEDFSEANLLKLQDQYRKWRDLSVIGAVAFYVLNIIDASVDAHLYNFDVGTNLSMRIQPHLIPSQLNTTFGVSLTFSRKGN